MTWPPKTDDLIAIKRAAGRPIGVTGVESLLIAKRRLGAPAQAASG